MRRFALSILHIFGVVMGWLGRATNSEYARVGRININLVFPELSSEEIDALACRSMRESGKLAAEMLINWFVPSSFFISQVRKVHGEHLFEEALKSGRGVVIIQPHLGNWEVLNTFIGRYAPYTLYKPTGYRVFDNIVKRSRERLGSKMVPFTNAGVRVLYRALAKSRIIQVLPDQLPDGPGSVVVKFLNVPAGTGTLLPRMIQKLNPVVLCVYAERLEKARGFDIHINTALEEVYSDDLEQSATALNKSMERLIRNSPEQYLWGYKRYKYTVDPKLYSRESPVQ